MPVLIALACLHTRDTCKIRDDIAPRTLSRVRRARRQNTVTVESSYKARGHIGGHDAGTFGRQVIFFRELQDFINYITEISLFTLGEAKNLIVLRQLKGVPLGGRMSKAQTSLLLGDGEGRLFNNLKS